MGRYDVINNLKEEQEMKKKISIAVIAMIGAIILGVGIFQSNASQGAPKLSTDEIRQMVLEQYPGEIEEIELETDFNRAVYEVEVVSEGKEYELKLDGNTGEVLKLKEKTINKKAKDKVAVNEDNDDDDNNNDDGDDDDKAEKKNRNNHQRHHDDDYDDHHHKERHHENKTAKKETTEKPTVEVKPKENKQQTTKETPKVNEQQSTEKSTPKVTKEPAPKQQTKKKTIISESEAISIAKSVFNGKLEDIELDEDDGRLIYEVELESGNEEAEIEIDAYTGEIIVIEIDRDDD